MQLLTGPYFSVGAALRHLTYFGYRGSTRAVKGGSGANGLRYHEETFLGSMRNKSVMHRGSCFH